MESVSGDLWVVAELAQVNVNRYSGHCYLDLVEKKDETTVASMRATIWAGVFKRIQSVFKRATGSELKQGMKVLMRGSLGFHEVYGLSFNVREIDPQYTLGEMALKRKETLERLKREGVIDLNRGLALPVVPQRIAVIASESSAGYGDFLSRMTGNPYGYSYSMTLLPAFMQGDRAEGSIIKALAQVRAMAAEFEVVVLIRGGGSQVDLSCFDSYALALEVARFPLPVLSGIGHERDETVLDRVSNRRLITPSAVAEFIVSRTRRFEDALEELRQRLVSNVTDMVGHERHRLAMASRLLVTSTRGLISESRHRLGTATGEFSRAARQGLGRSIEQVNRLTASMRSGARHLLSMSVRRMAELGGRLRLASGYRLRREPSVIDAITARLGRASVSALRSEARKVQDTEGKVRLLDPINVLRRGYSITLINGRVLKQASQVLAGDRLKTLLSEGEVTSIVENVENIDKEGGDA